MSTSIHNLVEELHPASESDRDMQDMNILATIIYMKKPCGWHIVLHHASVALEVERALGYAGWLFNQYLPMQE